MSRMACLAVVLCSGCSSPGTFALHDDGSGRADLTTTFVEEDLASGPTDDLAECSGATVFGRVLAPNGLDAVPGAKVFVPDGPVVPFPSVVGCDRCNQVPPSITLATAGADGRFALGGVPDGDVTLVIQLGRFRRVLRMHLDPCTSFQLPINFGRLPRRNGETDPGDHIPRFAVASGDYDQIECVLRRMGVEAIDIYDGRDGEKSPPTIGPLSALLADQKKLLSYDVVYVNCTENQFDALITQQGVQENLTKYASLGGRLYVTDWGYDVIEQVPAFSPFMCFEPQRGGQLMCGPVPQTLNNADSNDPYSNDAHILDDGLAQWLASFPGVIDNQRRVKVSYSFVVVDELAADKMAYPTKTWVEGDTGRFGVKPMTVTFDYEQCGRVHYSTFNTEPNGVVPDNTRYPNCKPDFSPQERILEYLVFQISGCVGISHQ